MGGIVGRTNVAVKVITRLLEQLIIGQHRQQAGWAVGVAHARRYIKL